MSDTLQGHLDVKDIHQQINNFILPPLKVVNCKLGHFDVIGLGMMFAMASLATMRLPVLTDGRHQLP